MVRTGLRVVKKSKSPTPLIFAIEISNCSTQQDQARKKRGDMSKSVVRIRHLWSNEAGRRRRLKKDCHLAVGHSPIKEVTLMYVTYPELIQILTQSGMLCIMLITLFISKDK